MVLSNIEENMCAPRERQKALEMMISYINVMPT